MAVWSLQNWVRHRGSQFTGTLKLHRMSELLKTSQRIRTVSGVLFKCLRLLRVGGFLLQAIKVYHTPMVCSHNHGRDRDRWCIHSGDTSSYTWIELLFSLFSRFLYICFCDPVKFWYEQLVIFIIYIRLTYQYLPWRFCLYQPHFSSNGSCHVTIEYTYICKLQLDK